VGLRVIGAGLPRTGTRSLKAALELLLGGTCYHMQDVVENLHHVPVWRRALTGDPPDWPTFLGGYRAAVDWPASAFWRPLAAANPDALIVLSLRPASRSWWQSANETILPGVRDEPPPDLREWQLLVRELLSGRLTPEWDGEAAANAAYARHNDEVRATAPAGRLLEWDVTQGWVPLCRALDLPVPEQPFPHFAGVHPRLTPPAPRAA
jgi:hypothetical protein